jgi:hypothetical protein
VEGPYDAATRMTGLRNLIFSLGLKNVNRPADARLQEAEAAMPYEPVHERPVYAQPYPPMPQGPDRQANYGPSPTLVTAAPEFLPPKPLVETTDREKDADWSTASAARRDRRDAFDDVEILPSWRGQYKKKKRT